MLSTNQKVVGLTLVSPAVRMVVVSSIVYRSGDEIRGEHEIHPVLSIQAKALRRPEFDEIEYDAIIYDSEYGICDAEFAFHSDSEAYETVPCPWPESEDEVRLADVIERTQNEAIRKMKQYEQSSKRSASALAARA